MKKILLTALLTGIAFFSDAQESIKELNYINASHIVGVYSVGNQAGVLTREGNRSIDRKDLYVLHFLNPDIPAQEIAVNQGSYLLSAESNAKGAVIVFNGEKDYSLVYVSPNTEPRVKAYPATTGYMHNNLSEAALNEDGSMTLFRNYAKLGKDREGKDSVIETGLEFITVNPAGEVIKNRYEKRTGYESDVVISIFPGPFSTAYMMESNSPAKKEYALNLILTDGYGNVTGKRLLSQANTLYPSGVLFRNGQYIVSGYYLKGSLYSAKSTEGLFMEIINTDGTLVSANTYDWDNLKTRLKENAKSDFVFNGKMSLQIEDISATSNGYRIIAESYSFGSGITPAEFIIGGNSSRGSIISVYDFVVFETNFSGEISSVNILPSEVSNIEIGSHYSGASALKVSNMMREHRGFPFRSLNGNNIQYVRYKKGAGFYAEMDLLTGDTTPSKPILIVPVIVEEVDKDFENMKGKSGFINNLDQLNKGVENFSQQVDEKGNAIVYGIEKTDRYFDPYSKSLSGIVVLPDKRVVTYLINPSNHTIYYHY